MELVRPGLDVNIDGGAPSHALLGIERVGDDVDLLNRIRGRNISYVGGEPWVGILNAINSRVDALIGLAVYVCVHGSFGIARQRVGLRNQSSAGNELQK